MEVVSFSPDNIYVDTDAGESKLCIGIDSVNSVQAYPDGAVRRSWRTVSRCSLGDTCLGSDSEELLS